MRAWTLLACACLALAAGSVLSGPARAAVYWGDGGRIAAAGLEGGSPQSGYFTPPFPSASAGQIADLAVSPSYLYWTGGFGIGRVNLEGPASPQTIVSGLRHASGIAVDEAHVYWTDSEDGTIGRANLDGTEVQSSLIAGLHHPCGLAVHLGRLFWTDMSGIGRANVDGTGVEPGFVPGALPSCAVAVDEGHIYWGEPSRRSIGRARIDGGESEEEFIGGLGLLAGIAVDSAHIFWSESSENPAEMGSIGRASLDGSEVSRRWLVADQPDLGGLDVDSRSAPPPLPLPSRPFRFGRLRQGRHGALLLDIWVPERGELSVSSPRIRWRLLRGPPPPPWRGGYFRWRLRLWPGRSGPLARRIHRQLSRSGRAPLTLRVTYTELGSLPVSASRRIAFRIARPGGSRGRP